MKNVDEQIDAAAAALREQTGEPASELEATRTRARILASHRGRRATPVTWLAAAAAIVIVLGGSTAWAYWTGRLGVRTTSEHVEEEAPSIVTPPVAPVHEVFSPEEEAPEVVTPVAPPEVIEVIAPEPPTSEIIEHVVDPRERAAYRAAHTAHFDDHDPAGAIALWDAYLATYPSGRFALEARYNRALCLVRLGRTSEARTALAPFVEGTHGGYRQQEATALAHALE